MELGKYGEDYRRRAGRKIVKQTEGKRPNDEG